MDDSSKLDFGDTQQSYDSGITLNSDYESRDVNSSNSYIVSVGKTIEGSYTYNPQIWIGLQL